MSADAEVIDAGRALAAAGLVDAFGHVSVRRDDLVLLTPAGPLGDLGRGDCLVPLSLDAADLPAGAPKEAWIHLGVYRLRPDVTAICRAHPPSVAAAAAAGLPIRPLHGHGAFLGREVPVLDDARLVRTEGLGHAVGLALGDASALVMRGTGSVTVAATPGRAVALMLVLERSARLNLEVAGTSRPARELTPDEVDAWQRVADELLDRLWAHLSSDIGSAKPAIDHQVLAGHEPGVV